MSILTVLIAIVVVGVLLWLVNTYIPMEPLVKKILNIVVIVILAVWLLKALGFWHALSSVRV